MYHAALPWVAIDPKGDWWGLRSSKDGTGPGLPVPIFGGLHGDMPLVPEAGKLIADLIYGDNLTCVLDVSEFASKAAQMRFLADLAERLFRLHGKQPQPRHVFLEEADDFIPQRVMRDQARCVGAWTKLVKQGGSRGLGITLISQRSAVVNKDALTQAETLIALRTTSPQDRKAILDWVSYHDVAREVVDSLPGLDDGEAWVCSPHWLARHGQPPIQKTRFRQRATYDSGATPTIEGKRRPATLADIDLGDILSRMEAVTEKAAQDDPAALRRRVADLERKLKTAGDAPTLAAENRDLRAQLDAALARPPERVEIPVLTPGDLAAAEQVITALRDVTGSLEVSLSRAAQPPKAAAPAAPASRPAATAPRPAERPRQAPAAEGDAADLTKAQRAVLSVLAQFPDGRSKKQVAMLTRYSHTSGGFNGALAGLRSAGLIGRGEPMLITDAGLEALGGEWEPLPTGPDLIDYWLSYLSKAEGTVLRLLLDSWPAPMSKAAIAAAADYSPTSGGFNGALARLRSLQLITGGAEAMYPDETLAEHAGSVDA